MKTIVVTLCAGVARIEDQLLITSTKRMGIPLVVTQVGEDWENYYINKIYNLRRDLNTLDFDIAIFADAADVFFTSKDGVEKSVEIFEKCGKDIMVSGELNCHPWPQKHIPLFPQDGPRHKFPNAGAWMGKRDALLAELDLMISREQAGDPYTEEGGATRSNCDQQYWCEAAIEGRAAVNVTEDWCLNLYNMVHQEIYSIPNRQVIPVMIHGSSYPMKRHVNALYRQMVIG